MNKSLRAILSVSIVLGISLPMAAMARGHGGGGPRYKPSKVEQDTIAELTPTTITVTHNKPAAPPVGRRGSQQQQPTGPQTETISYRISDLTDVEVNGQMANAGMLKVGMAVSISADPPFGESSGPNDGGTATTIIARDAPANDTASTTKTGRRG